MHDYDYYNEVAAENRQQQKWEREERNRILAMSNTQRKQAAWNKLYPKLALEGLSEEDLERVY